MPTPTDPPSRIPVEIEARLEEIKLRLKRGLNSMSREVDFLWIIRQLTELTTILFTELYKEKESRYGKAPRRR